MSYAFSSLKRQISKTAEGEGKYSLPELDEMIYKKYSDGKLTDREYRDLCDLLEYVG